MTHPVHRPISYYEFNEHWRDTGFHGNIRYNEAIDSAERREIALTASNLMLEIAARKETRRNEAVAITRKGAKGELNKLSRLANSLSKLNLAQAKLKW